MKTIENININKKTVLLRCDLNVTIKNKKILDDNKIRASLKTINYILEQNSKLVIMSHLGKIKEEQDKEKNNMEIVYKRLNELLPNKIKFINTTDAKEIKKEIKNINYGEAILIQNTRYEDLDNKKESNCDKRLSKSWASMADVFVNDAFGTIHRRHASNYGVSCYLPSVIGFLVKKELENLNKLRNPEKPFVVIMGGAKVSDKTKIIDSLIKKADHILIGGAMAFTFLKASGYEIGKSYLEKDSIELCEQLLKKYKDKIILPVDFYGDIEGERHLRKVGNIDKEFKGLDIGKETVKEYKEILKNAKTVFWNGPLGMYEEDEYIYGTKEVLKYIKKKEGTVILGGGDVVAASNILNYTKDITFASTGGGATLKYIENHNQPGLENIKK